jgi:hypothetical protein
MMTAGLSKFSLFTSWTGQTLWTSSEDWPNWSNFDGSRNIQGNPDWLVAHQPSNSQFILLNSLFIKFNRDPAYRQSYRQSARAALSIFDS